MQTDPSVIDDFVFPSALDTELGKLFYYVNHAKEYLGWVLLFYFYFFGLQMLSKFETNLIR